MDEMYEVVHQDAYRFFGIHEMYKLVIGECTKLFECDFLEIG